MRRGPGGRASRDRGAAAVEFALLLPVLLFLIFGIIDFGRALNAQLVLTQAARAGSRLAALGDSTASVTSATQGAATGLSPVTVTVTACPVDAGVGVNAKVQATYSFTFITPINAIAHMFGSNFGSGMTLTATGVMPCET